VGQTPKNQDQAGSGSLRPKPIFEFIEGEVNLFNDYFERKVNYPFDWFRSALATVQPRAENTKLMQFKNWIENLHCLSLNPWNMSGLAEREAEQPTQDLSNFAPWYRYMTQERGDAASSLREHLRKIMPGLESLDLRSAGANTRTLAVRFVSPGPDADDGTLPEWTRELAANRKGKERFTVGFRELSEGQRVLICLYALLNFVVGPQACIFLDEPENFVAIPEIQPWLVELRDRLDEGGQVILLSHHPEIINYLAPDIGLVFERSDTGPVRVSNYQSGSPLSPAEQIARGW
jgi:hypothetical protein